MGRYVVLAKLGAGGMGVVYAAYDPELDRKMALKVLQEGLEGSGGPARLLREAQALARLSHPNIVTVYDAGTHDGRVWLAMEFIEGATLSDWRKETPRSWQEVVAVLTEAARGVAAAHAAGLLHRDLKPDNIMIGRDGRARVMDFGLARTPAQDGREAAVLEETGVQPRVEALAVELTQAGSLVGTPLYMAPEQLRGQSLGPAADQYSFCATLWESLYGTPPFRGDSLIDLTTAVVSGQLAPTKGRRVPRWLRRAIRRGLAVDANDRWPSMSALIAAIRRGRGWSRLSRGLAAVAVVAAVGAAGWGWPALDRRAHVAACEAEGQTIRDVWNENTRERVEAALLATGVSHAQVTLDKLMPWLDEHAQSWRATRTDICLNETVRGAWDDDLASRGRWCLEERQMELDGLVGELSRGDARSVRNAVSAAAGLSQPGRCSEAALLARLPVPPAERRDEVSDVKAALSRATALEQMGAYDDGLDVIDDALARAADLGWPPLVAAARARLGSLLERKGSYQEAEAALEEAYFEAAAADALELASRTARGLTFIVGNRLARQEDALRWTRHGEIVAASLPDIDGLRSARYAYARAVISRAMGREAEAKQLAQRSLAGIKAALGAEHPDVAKSLNVLAILYWSEGDYAKARELFEQAVALWEGVMGPEHPEVAMFLTNLALVRHDDGAYEDAALLHSRALAVMESALGPEHPAVASSLNNLALTHLDTGEYEEAIKLLQRSLAIKERSLGDEHPELASTLTNLGEFQQLLGDHADARESLQRAISIRERALGADHPDVALTLRYLGSTHLATGALDEAEDALRRALTIEEEASGVEHPQVSYPLIGLAQVELARGRPGSARPLAERAQALLQDAEVPPADEGDAHFVLAQALWGSGGQRERAAALAAQAQQAYRRGGPAVARRAEEVRDWIGSVGAEGDTL